MRNPAHERGGAALEMHTESTERTPIPADIEIRAARPGCFYGCPLDHHEDDCPRRREVKIGRRCSADRICSSWGIPQLAGEGVCPCREAIAATRDPGGEVRSR